MPSIDITSETLKEAQNISRLLSGLFDAGFDPHLIVDVFTGTVTEYSRDEDMLLQEKEGYDIYWSSIFWDFGSYAGKGYSPVVSSGKKPETEKRFREEAHQLLRQSSESNTAKQTVNRDYFILSVPVAKGSRVYGSIGYGISMPSITRKFLISFFSRLIPQVLLGFALLTLVPGAVITYMLGHRINILRLAAEGFLEGSFGRIKIPPAKDELGLLADVIIKLDSSLPALLEDRRQAGMWDERNRVAMKLHDTIKQDLFALYLNAETLEKKTTDNSSIRKMAGEIKNGISAALETARSLIHTYTSDIFGRSELESGIKSELEKWKRSGAIRHFSLVLENCIIPDKTAEACFMITREAAANAARHSGATEINVGISFDSGNLRLRVIDNGAGLSPGWKAGFGVLLMRQRASECGGTFSMQSAPGSGAVIEVLFPLNEQETGVK